MPPFRNWKNPTPDDLAFLNTLDARAKSEIYPLPITARAHPCVRAGMEQCFVCGKFGHRKPCLSKKKYGAPYFPFWRRTNNGRSYSINKLRLTDEQLAVASLSEAGTFSSPDAEKLHLISEWCVLVEVEEDEVDIMQLSSDDIALLEAAEEKASLKASSQIQASVVSGDESDEIDELDEPTGEAMVLAAKPRSTVTGKQVTHKKLRRSGGVCYHCFGRVGSGRISGTYGLRFPPGQRSRNSNNYQFPYIDINHLQVIYNFSSNSPSLPFRYQLNSENEMANPNSSTRITRRTRGEEVEEGAVAIAPPSSNITNLEQRAPLDGEAIEEERRDAVARSMESDHESYDEDEDQDSEDDTYDAQNEESDPDSSSSSQDDSSDPENSSSDESTKESSDEDSSSGSSSEDSSEEEGDTGESNETIKNGNKRDRKSLKAIDKVIAKAMRAREKAKARLAEKKLALKDRKAMSKHGKRTTSSKVKSSSNKKDIKKENGIKFQKGEPCKSMLPTLQTYWGEAMKTLSESVPLTVLNPTFVQKDKRSHPPFRILHVLRRMDRWDNPTKKILEENVQFLNTGKPVEDAREACKRHKLFGHRGKGVPVPDASIYVESFERAAKEKATRQGEFSFGNENPYAKGARFEHRDPITGMWEESAARESKKRRGQLTRQNSSSNSRRIPRLPRGPRLPDIIEMLPPARREPAQEGNHRTNRGGVRRGRGSAVNIRGRARHM
ncbi:uncharacterized protein MELLADRAFT_106234 [Melampsora larici-populina 98AG31]|uniref:Uncharacterized protein n=1 Tax=Melampsora larici-populina (strain 98AG31 / pathotype 3-4-7) TaxID=747676 RepID=F4RLH4_MELLP|nr:uncharacterized protein MELLADRAFT_106234 [Melampsora larici-populina 98AG31]EGG06770.1 hypothetical protein MELLADRAFT_106234 [Melampsora larici-populina 98AG31]